MRFFRTGSKYFKVFLILIVISFIFSTNLQAGELKIHFLDVAQGDAVLIELPGEEVMLIDAGKNGKGPLVGDYLGNKDINTIDYLIGTHPHADHIGGLDYIIKNFNIEKFFMPEVTTNTRTFAEVLKAVKEKNMKITAARAGRKLVNRGDLKIKFLSPIKNDYENLNDWSAVIIVSYKEFSCLLMGDAEEKIERDIIKSAGSTGGKLKVDILKVGHHGSDSSTTKFFLENIQPQSAVISAGADNSYGHPSSKVIARLQNFGTKIYRTDFQGTITAVYDNGNIHFDKSAWSSTSNLEPKKNESKSSVKIIRLDCEEEIVVLKNTEKSKLNISGWQLLSTVGEQKFCFPGGTIIKPGKKLKIISGSREEKARNYLKWSGAFIWNNEGDKAELYNEKGVLISEKEN